MIRVLFLLTLFPFFIQAQGQFTTDSIASCTIAVQAKLIDTDPSGNLYVVNKSNQLYKYNPTGKLLSTLNYSYQGNIAAIDANNPLEVYVFYKELNKVVFLDNNLAYRGECDLTAFGCGQVAAVCRSYDNGIWVFDLSDMQLKKFTKEGKNFLSSGNVKLFVNKDSFNPTSISDNGKQVVLSDVSTGIIVFDVMATFTKVIAANPTSPIKLSSRGLFYIQSETPIFYDPISYKSFPFVRSGFVVGSPALLTPSLLITLTPNEVRCYKH